MGEGSLWLAISSWPPGLFNRWRGRWQPTAFLSGSKRGTVLSICSKSRVQEKSTKGHAIGVDLGYGELGANVAKGGQRIKEYKRVCANERHMYLHIYIKQESMGKFEGNKHVLFCLKVMTVKVTSPTREQKGTACLLVCGTQDPSLTGGITDKHVSPESSQEK